MRRPVRWALVCLLTVGTLASSGPVAPGTAEVWITLERETARALAEVLRRSGHGHAFTVEHVGEIVVARIAEEHIPVLAHMVHQRLRRCGGFMAHDTREAALQEAQRDQQAGAVERPIPVEHTIDNHAVVNAMLPHHREQNIRDTILGLGAYHTRYYTTQTGVAAAQWLKARWERYARGRSDVTVELYNHAGWAQPSVIMTIRGTWLPDEVVVVGGHLDSINSSAPSTGQAPGADDDASGVASLTETINVAMTMGYRPVRTVKFMAYAAEEVGLRGSQEIANSYSAQGVNVVGVLQLDMTNYKGSPTLDMVMITDRTNATQNAFVRKLIDTYLGLPHGNSVCGYGCSDHSSWNARGYPASFPFEAPFGQHNMNLHKTTDTLAPSGGTADHALKFAMLATAYVAELAKGSLETQ